MAYQKKKQSTKRERKNFEEKYKISMPKINTAYKRQLNEIKEKMDDENEIVFDSCGVRWIKCQYCDEIMPSEYFVVYGGENAINKGKCRLCMAMFKLKKMNESQI